MVETTDPDGDPDGDGLTNSEEDALGTDPANPDTDGDGRTDGGEVGGTDFPSNPLDPDSDDDGLGDLEEARETGDRQLRPRHGRRLGPNDGDEVHTYQTHPHLPDTDDDRLSDGDEVNMFHTNPTIADTDGDGFYDGGEVIELTDPNDAGSHPCDAEPRARCSSRRPGSCGSHPPPVVVGVHHADDDHDDAAGDRAADHHTAAVVHDHDDDHDDVTGDRDPDHDDELHDDLAGGRHPVDHDHGPADSRADGSAEHRDLDDERRA